MFQREAWGLEIIPVPVRTHPSITLWLRCLERRCIVCWLVLAGIYCYHHNRDYGSALFFHRLPTKVYEGLAEKKNIFQKLACQQISIFFFFQWFRQGSKSHVFFHVSFRLKTSKILVRAIIILDHKRAKYKLFLLRLWWQIYELIANLPGVNSERLCQSDTSGNVSWYVVNRDVWKNSSRSQTLLKLSQSSQSMMTICLLDWVSFL